ncbi:UPF0481 protein At3g47200-like [Cannabis sativa]|nr:UPF0481 protein At3g47200-like [Cannabis sativa]
MEKREASSSSFTKSSKSHPKLPNEKNKDYSKIIIREFENWSNHHTIFRVPKMFRDIDEKAYTPQLVSIGPFHYGEKSLEGMQSHKENYYFKKFLDRTEKSEDDLSNFIKQRFDVEILPKYAGFIELDLNEFVHIILIDACFIFELLCSCWKKDEMDNDYILRTPLFFGTIKLDLMMLENQIPFFFLDELYEFSRPLNYPPTPSSNPNPTPSCDLKLEISSSDDHVVPSFMNLSLCFFGLNFNTFLDKTAVKHFTDLHRRSWIPIKEDYYYSKTIDNNKENVTTTLFYATKLDQAGIDFAPPPPKQDAVVKVYLHERWYTKFLPFLSSCKLQLPVLKIQDNTQNIMRNIIAMEQCLPDSGKKTPFCNYVSLINKLINTEEDVALLIEKNVIENHLGSTICATDMINNLCQNMTLATFMYSKEYYDINKFYNVWYNRAKATLIRIYFNDVWTTSSTFVAVMIVIFTTISTIDSIWSLLEK